jgi:hypothetical protein
MRMLKWMSEVTREDRIRNEYVRGSIGVASIVDKIRENRLKLCGHIIRETRALKLVMKINVERKRGRDRQKRHGWIRLRMI